mmetsp:Transcript_91274/g.279401  ORF Transcript_91274/g.279401 Transcript_91274/m.279401 type:complete len:308 (-) Transcript_91274:185-1108(-)
MVHEDRDLPLHPLWPNLAFAEDVPHRANQSAEVAGVVQSAMQRHAGTLGATANEDVPRADQCHFPVNDRMDARDNLGQLLRRVRVLAVPIEVGEVIVPRWLFVARKGRDLPRGCARKHHLEARDGLVVLLLLLVLGLALGALFLLLRLLHLVEMLRLRQVAVAVACEAVQVHQRVRVLASGRLHHLLVRGEVQPAVREGGLQPLSGGALRRAGLLPGVEEPTRLHALVHGADQPLAELPPPLGGGTVLGLEFHAAGDSSAPCDQVQHPQVVRDVRGGVQCALRVVWAAVLLRWEGCGALQQHITIRK